MRRWTTTLVLGAAMGLGLVPGAGAQPRVVAGGLTALPPLRLGPNLVQNGGFETLSGGLPAGWSGGSGWGVDQLVTRAGALSFRRTAGAGTASQTVRVAKGTYRFSAWIKTEGLGTGGTSGVRLQVDLRPTLGQWFTTDVISGTRDWTLYEVKNVVVPQDMTVTLKLESYGNPGGTAWFDEVRFEEQLRPPVDVFLLYPNFRGILFDDAPPVLRFAVAVTPPGGDLARYRVVGTVRDEETGQTVSSRSFAAADEFVAELDATGMQAGRPYLATFALVDQAGGGVVYTYPAYRVSRAPASARAAMTISVDDKNRILVRGRPRFLLGLYDSGGGYSTADSYWESQLWSPTGARRLEGIRFNAYLNYWMGEAPADAMKALMSNLQKRGVLYLQTGNCFDRHPAGGNFLINASDAYVRDIGAHPGSAGYYTIDECRSELVPSAFEQYKRLRALDPDSMTFAALFGHPDIVLWRDAADVLASDPYPLYAAEPPGGYNHGQVAEWTRQTREAVKGARPIMTVLQFFKFTSQGRWPTRQEMRNHAYMAIVEGAQGLWWWSVGNGNGALASAACSPPDAWCAERTARLADLRAVVNELADLEPVLLADDAPRALTGNSNPSAVRTRVKVAGGRGYVFAYNATRKPVSATFAWHTAPGAVTVHGEGRTLPVQGTAFTDSFGPFQAHVYVVANGGGSGGSGSGGAPPPSSTPPTGGLTVTFTNPPANATVSGTRTVSLAVSGGSGSYTYRVSLDAQPAGSLFTGSANTFSWNTATASNGPHVLRATVVDTADPSRTGSATVAVTVANPPAASPPASGGVSLAITAPRAGATVSGTSWVVLWLEGTTSTANTYTLTVDGLEVARQATASRGPVSLAWDTRRVPNGARTLVARAVDAGGRTATAQVTVTVANAGAGTPPPPPSSSPPTAPAGPVVVFTSPAEAATVSGDVIVNVWVERASAGSTIYSLYLDDRLVGTQVSTGPHVWFSVPTRGVTNGTHTLTATVRDAAGRTATARRLVTVRN